MNRILPFPGMRPAQAAKAANEASTEPVVGMQALGLMPMSMNALTKREAACLSSGSPSAGGYCEHIPESSARFSASVPHLFIGRPGEPWSMRTKGIPVLSSRYCAASRISPIVAVERSLMLQREQASRTSSSLNTFMYLVSLL